MDIDSIMASIQEEASSLNEIKPKPPGKHTDIDLVGAYGSRKFKKISDLPKKVLLKLNYIYRIPFLGSLVEYILSVFRFCLKLPSILDELKYMRERLDLLERVVSQSNQRLSFIESAKEQSSSHRI